MRLLLLLAVLLFTPFAHAARPPPEATMRALSRGVNLSIWFTYRGQTGIDPARWYPDAADWRRIKALGFTHVRVQFDPALLQVVDANVSAPFVQIQPLSGFLQTNFVIKKLACNALDPTNPRIVFAGLWLVVTEWAAAHRFGFLNAFDFPPGQRAALWRVDSSRKRRGTKELVSRELRRALRRNFAHDEARARESRAW